MLILFYNLFNTKNVCDYNSAELYKIRQYICSIMYLNNLPNGVLTESVASETVTII